MTKNLHSKTKTDLAKIDSIKKQQAVLEKKVTAIKNNCKCFDKEATYCETLKFEFSPVLQCIVCGKKTKASEEDKIALLREFYACIDREDLLTAEFIERNKDGFTRI